MIYAIAVVLVLIMDQALKYYTVSNIVLNTGEVPLIDGLVHLTHVHNYGAAFSILQNTRWLLVGMTVVFVIAVIYALSTDLIQGPLGRWSALMVLAGALGNGIDRLFIGYVVDMIEVEFISFPVFNIADIFVTVFGVLFCGYIVFHKSPEPEEEHEHIPLSQRVKRAREQEPERRGGDIEMVRKASVHQPRRAPQPRPEPQPVDKADPFAEWEAKKAAAAAPVRTKAEPADSYIAEAPKAPAAPKKPAADDMEFDIDDILAEFKD
ncbi:MAG: signal peptidase II [Candidatus Heteroscillospira sp.]|jgi:signal peptidase II